MITNVTSPCLLVAMPSLLDGNFAKTVVLLAEHNSEGAVGFVINRPSTVSLRNMIHGIDRDISPAIPAWYGGPVDTGTAIILHARTPGDGDTEIGDGIFLSTSGRVLDRLIDESEKTIRERLGNQLVHEILNPYRFLVGYAGWGAGQLDEEIRSGAWLIHPIDRELVLNTIWSEVWPSIVQRIGVHRQSSSVVSPTTHSTQYLN